MVQRFVVGIVAGALVTCRPAVADALRGGQSAGSHGQRHRRPCAGLRPCPGGSGTHRQEAQAGAAAAARRTAAGTCPPRRSMRTSSMGMEIGAVEVQVDVDLSGTGGFSNDGEYLPIVKVQPIYPRRAQTRGIEGYVLLGIRGHQRRFGARSGGDRSQAARHLRPRRRQRGSEVQVQTEGGQRRTHRGRRRAQPHQVRAARVGQAGQERFG